MDWVTGIQRAVNYIEEHLTEQIDYEAAAAQSFCSSYHFQRVFSILCGFTVGEYVRCRRLALAGAELAAAGAKVIDVALKYGYENPDSFAQAFQKFHGILPSQASRTNLKSFSRLVLKFSLEGGHIMNYRIEQKPTLTFTGIRRHFTGTTARRAEQEKEFYLSTRLCQYALHGMARDCATNYNIMMNFDDEGYDFYIASLLDSWTTQNLNKVLGAEDAGRFEKITVPAALYLVCETERTRYPVTLVEELRCQAVSEWLPSSGYQLADAPELSVHHWFWDPDDLSVGLDRYVELWIPIVSTKS